MTAEEGEDPKLKELISALEGLQATDAWGSKKEQAAVLLENAEAARATKQTDRVLDYCTEAVSLSVGCLGEQRQALLGALDGTQDKVMALMDSGEAVEGALDVLVTEAQIRQLSAEAHMDKGQLLEAKGDLEVAEEISAKLSDEVETARCLRSRGMLCLMQKDVATAEELLRRSVQMCRTAEEPKEEAAALKLLIKLHGQSEGRFDRVCELYHELLEAHQRGGASHAVSMTLLRLGQFRLEKHLSDTSKGVELEYADLEMTDMDLGGALDYLSRRNEEGLGSDEDEGGGGEGDLAEVLTAVGTVKMLLGEQEHSISNLEKAVSVYSKVGDGRGEMRAQGLLSDVRRILDKVDSTAVTPSG